LSKYLGDTGRDIEFPKLPVTDNGAEIDPSLCLDLKVAISLLIIKVNFSEKAIKIWGNCLQGFEVETNFCGLLRKAEL
jgi:hypothetical protein